MRAAALATLLLCVLLTTGMLVAPSSARDDDPTWAEVQKAKRDVRAKASAVQRIQAALDALEAEAARLGTVAVQRAAVATAAEERLESAQAAVDRLQTQVAAARKRAGTAKRTAGAVATQLYRAGDPTLSVWLAGQHSGSLLYRLGTLAQIGDSSSAMLAEAVVDQRLADALGREAASQAAVRDRLADSAKAAANTAKAAQAAADAEVASTKTRRAALTAKLRELKATSNALQASYAAAQEAKRAAAAAGDGGGSALGGLAGGPASLSPAGAQAYAAGRLSAYGWSGGQMSCLIRLWNIESGWRWNAYNASSGAYGIPQSLPGSKMATAGGDWTTSSRTQIEWGLGYIKARYSTPCGALAFETSHVPYWY